MIGIAGRGEPGKGAIGSREFEAARIAEDEQRIAGGAALGGGVVEARDLGIEDEDHWASVDTEIVRRTEVVLGVKGEVGGELRGGIGFVREAAFVLHYGE